jgi:hypothetical protein
MLIEIPSSNAARSSSAVKPKSKRSKTSVSLDESQNPPSSIDSLALPASAKVKTNEKTVQKDRKKKVRTDEEIDELASAEITIGLPKERYKPRPSRSRSEDNVDQAAEQPQSLQKKSSGLDSDEIAIGLPKEQYKPQPSRSRSGQPPEVVEALDFSKPKKKKLRRGMTTGRILKKKVIDSDEEDDVIYVNERPRKDGVGKGGLELVKEDVSEEISEESSAVRKGRQLEIEEEGQCVIFQVETTTTLSDHQPNEPKKRGRKRKNTSENTPDAYQIKENEQVPSEEVPPSPATKEPEPHQPKKRGRKPKQVMETISEAEDVSEAHDAQPEPVQDDIEVVVTKAAEPEAAEPKKRGRKKKTSGTVVDAVNEEVDEIAGEVSLNKTTAAAESARSEALKEKHPNTNSVSTTEPTTKGDKVRLLDHQNENTGIQDRDQNTIAPSDPLETPRKPSTTNPSKGTETPSAVTTPTAPTASSKPDTKKDDKEKGPTKHSPLGKPKVPFRVGLSKRARIEPLLKVRRA